VKIALVTNSFPSTSETFVYNHAAGLQAAGLDVTVIVARPSSDTSLFADHDGLRFTGPIRTAVLADSIPRTAWRLASELVSLRSRDGTLWSSALARYGTTVRALRAGLLALPCRGFDIVHFEYSGLAVAWLDALPLLSPTKIAVSCRGSAERVTPLLEPTRAAALRSMFEHADLVHCVSTDMVKTCVRYGLDPGRALVNHPAIDIERFRRSIPYVARTSGPYRLLSTGRLQWMKGLEFALMAVRALLDAGHDVHYELVGSGPAEAELRYTAHDLDLEDRVTFSGKRSSTEVRSALERCDVFVLPSVSEGMSNAALEAMAMEIPVVTTSAGGMTEALSDEVEGLVVPSRDAAALARAVERLLRDGSSRVTMGQAGRRRIARDFALDRQIETYVQAYSALLR
jgi:glycosyltransferase involved in cell wall biosynthesis